MPEVRLLGGLRDKLGGTTLRVEAACVRRLIAALVERGGPEVARIFYADPASETPAASRDLRVLVNGRSMVFLEGFDTPLRETDAVTVHLSGARGYPGG